MKTLSFYSLLLIAAAIYFTSCKKDTIAQWSGNYMATVRYQLYNYADTTTPVKDTTYKMVLLTVSKSSGSTRKKAIADITFYSAHINLTSMNNLPVNDGSINYYTTDNGVPFVRTWNGSFSNDSLHLIYREEDTIMYIANWDIKAVKK